MAHGKQSRERNRLKKLAQKRARRASMKALYDERRRTGQNKKSKRFRQGAKGTNKTPKPERILMEVTVKFEFRFGRDLFFTTAKGEVTKAIRRVHGGLKCRNIGCKRCSSLWN